MWEQIDVEEFVANSLKDKPEPTQSNDFVNKLYGEVQPDAETMRIALVTDFHVDYDYEEGMSNVCQ